MRVAAVGKRGTHPHRGDPNTHAGPCDVLPFHSAELAPGSYFQAVLNLAPSAKVVSTYSLNSILRSKIPVCSIMSRM
jgi:hypothetical protein